MSTSGRFYPDRTPESKHMSKPLNIGLIGSGFMGQAHADAYRRAGILYRNLPRTPVLYAIADQNESLAEEARRKLGSSSITLSYCANASSNFPAKE